MRHSDWRVVVYRQDQQGIEKDLREGAISYVGLSAWTFVDELFAFLLGVGFFDWAHHSYPSPRVKEELPVWFLIACGLQMKLHTTSSFNRLPGILGSGSILTRVGFNVGGINGGGFNNKNRSQRKTPLHMDAVRKFYKDTQPQALRRWYNQDVTRFLRSQRAFDKHGIFVLDQTHVVVADNDNYRGAVRMPMDEHGQRIDIDGLTTEQKKAIKYRLTYALSELLHVNAEDPGFIVAGYQWGGGNVDELVQGRLLVDDFVKAVGKGVMKTLIVDRGYIDGEFVSHVKADLGVDVIVPLRKNMDMVRDAIRLAEEQPDKCQWKDYRSFTKAYDDGRSVLYAERVCLLDECGIWDACSVDLHICLMRVEGSDHSVHYWALVCTFKPSSAHEVFHLYDKRTQIEERHKQLKNVWDIAQFSSPHESLIETHVLFTLLTYSLVQLFLTRKHLSELARKTIDSLRLAERNGVDSTVVYHQDRFAVFHIMAYTQILLQMNPDARQRLSQWVDRSKANELMRIE